MQPETVADLGERLRALTVALLNKLGGQPFPARQVMIPEFPEPGRMNATGKLFLDLDPILLAMDLTWQQWPEFLDVLNVVRHSPELRALILSDAASNPVSEDYEPRALSWTLRFLMSDYLWAAQHTPAQFDEPIFDRLYSSFVHSIEAGGRRVCWWVPLYDCNLESGIAPIQLSPTVSIVELDEWTRGRIGPQADISGRYRPIVRWYLMLEETIPFHAPHPGLLPAAQAWVTAVRLAVGGACSIHDARLETIAGQCMAMGAIDSTQGEPPRFGVRHPSEVTANEIDRIRQLASALPALEANFPIALSRYQQIASRDMPADKLIDAIVGLEHLLLQGYNDELSFRFALRGAWLLGGDAHHPRRQFAKRLSTAYAVRSKVVHGDPRASKTLTGTAVADAVSLLQQVLVKAAERRMTATQWKVYLDDIVFG